MQNGDRRLRRRAVAVLALSAVMAIGLTMLVRERATAHENDEQLVREALLQSAVGFERGDLNILNKVWANDESVTVFESGHANYGWADYRDHHLVPEMKELKNTKYTLSDIKIKVSGKTAWATFKYAISADVQEEGKTHHVDGGGLGTVVLEERAGRWQIVHWHSSAPRRAPTPAASPAKTE